MAIGKKKNHRGLGSRRRNQKRQRKPSKSALAAKAAHRTGSPIVVLPPPPIGAGSTEKKLIVVDTIAPPAKPLISVTDLPMSPPPGPAVPEARKEEQEIPPVITFGNNGGPIGGFGLEFFKECEK